MSTKINILIVFLFVALVQQAQIVVNNSGVININGGVSLTPTYLVLNNPPATPITTIGTTGGIMMESEYNITKYNLGLLTRAITVPYFSSALEQFPLAVTGISAGTETAVGAGNIQFSSKKAPTRATGWQNSTYLPSDETTIFDGWIASTYTVDNSPNAIDRFWVIDALGYSTTPGVTYSFGFIAAEAAANTSGSSNTITVANLQAEAYDRVAHAWGNYGPTGVNSGTAVGSVVVGSGLIGTKYRSWTLVDNTNPLPVDLVSFTGTCVNSGFALSWSTASESNSSYFTVEKSYDAQTFTSLATINAAGNSSTIKKYNYFDGNENSNVYYRLSQTDKNGDKKVFKLVSVEACNEKANEVANVFSSGSGNINLSIYSQANQAVDVTVYDVTGRLIYKEQLSAEQGTNHYTINPAVNTGIYLVEIKTNNVIITKRVPIIE